MRWRGMTLIEILASVAILSLLAVAVAPIMRDAATRTASLRDKGDSPLAEGHLRVFADDYIHNYLSGGMPDLATTRSQIGHTEGGDVVSMQIVPGPSDGNGAIRFVWLLFEHKECTCVRWIAIEQEVTQ